MQKERFIESRYEIETHKFEFSNISEIRKKKYEIKGGAPPEFDQRFLILTTNGLECIHFDISKTIEQSVDDRYLMESKNVILGSHAFERFTFTSMKNDYGFEFRLFSAIETYARDLLEYLKLKPSEIKLVAISDPHGDIPLLLFPFFFTAQLSCLEYREDIGLMRCKLQNGTNIVINGDLFPSTTLGGSARCKDFLKLMNEEFMIFINYLNRFIIRFIIMAKYFTNLTLIIGNHDTPLFNEKFELEDCHRRKLTNIGIYKDMYIRKCFKFGNYSFSFTHGILNCEDQKSVMIGSKRYELETNKHHDLFLPDMGRSLIYPNFFYNRTFKVSDYERSETELVREIGEYPIIHIPVLGHTANYDLIPDKNSFKDGEFINSDRTLKEANEHRFNVITNRYFEPKSVIENVICLDSSSNSFINVYLNDLRKRMELLPPKSLLPQRRVRFARLPFCEKQIELSGGNNGLKIEKAICLFLLIIVLIVSLVCVMSQFRYSRIFFHRTDWPILNTEIQ